MDSHQLFGYGLSAADITSGFSSSTLPFPEWLAYPIKFEPSNSHSSLMSDQIDCGTVSCLSCSQEQPSSTEIFAVKSPSHCSSLETDSSQRLSPLSFQEGIEAEIVEPPRFSIQSERYALQELESILMAPDTDEATTSTYLELGQCRQPEVSKSRSRSWEQISQQDPALIQLHQYTGSKGLTRSPSFRPEKRMRDTKEMLCGVHDVRELLIDCVRAISENRISDFELLCQKARSCISISGEPIQRLGAYMLEGLVARKEASGTKIYRSLKCDEPAGNELLSYMQILYDVCPYFKFGYMAANGAIAEAVRTEDRIHIIDFQISQGTQWVTLIQALAARPGGPPSLRITGIDDPVSKYARGDNLQLVGKRLAMMSEKFNIPLEFNAVPVYAQDVTKEVLDIRPGEALAVNFTLQLHHTPDESVDVNNPRDGLLRMVKGLSPKVTTLVEQESNTNTTPFFVRFMETLDYYTAMFESLDEALPRDNKDRINVEQHCLAKDIVNIIACEGKDRIERHELLGKWRSRLSMAGFKPYPLSTYVNSVIKSLLRCYSSNYTLVEKDGAMLLGWKNRNLISASAWH